MAQFEYHATDPSGKHIEGSMEASDERALVSRLQDMGYLPISVGAGESEAKASKTPHLGLRLFPRVRAREVVNFTHGFSSMLEAGLPLDRSLSILAELEKNSALKEIILEIHKGIRAGRSLADCFGNYPELFSEVFVNTVLAGEAGGALETALSRVTKFMEDAQKLKDDIYSALMYPLLLTAVGGSAVFVMLLFVIPKFSAIFADIGGVMPLPTRVLLYVSEGIAAYWWAMALIFGGILFSIRRYYRTEEGRLVLDRLKMKIPLFGQIVIKSVVSRFSRTLGTLLQAGLPILEALKLARKTMGNSLMALDIEPVIEGVRRGRGMAEPLREAASFPPLAVHMLTVGEETGKLDEMLLKLADNFDRDISTSIKRLLSLLEPAIILVMAVVVGFIVISLLLAIFSINDMPI